MCDRHAAVLSNAAPLVLKDGLQKLDIRLRRTPIAL